MFITLANQGNNEISLLTCYHHRMEICSWLAEKWKWSLWNQLRHFCWKTDL